MAHRPFNPFESLPADVTNPEHWGLVCPVTPTFPPAVTPCLPITPPIHYTVPRIATPKDDIDDIVTSMQMELSPEYLQFHQAKSIDKEFFDSLESTLRLYERSPEILYVEGIQLAKNPDTIEQAIAQFQLAANKKHVGAIFAIGHIYLKGTSGTGVDWTIAQKHLQEAAELGSVDALCALGELHQLTGAYQQAFNYFSTAAQRGHTGALIFLADWLINENSDKPDVNFKRLRFITAEGTYRRLDGTTQDITPRERMLTAVEYFKLAALSWDPAGLMNLGHAYSGCWEHPENLVLALEYFKQAKSVFQRQGKRDDAQESQDYINQTIRKLEAPEGTMSGSSATPMSSDVTWLESDGSATHSPSPW